jgi:hypothetical protein
MCCAPRRTPLAGVPSSLSSTPSWRCRSSATNPSTTPILTLTSSMARYSTPTPNEERFLAAEFYTDPVVITAFDHESRDLSHIGADFDDGPLFDEASEDLTSVKLSVPDSEFMARQPLLTLWSPIRQNARARPSTPLPWTTRLVLHRREWPWVLQGTVPCRLSATHTSFNRCHTFRGTHSDSFL